MARKIITPLRYPGGKSRAVNTLMPLIPSYVEEIVCPFIGGGSIELACAQKGIRVHGYDAFKPLASFWNLLINSPLDLIREVKKYFPLTTNGFYKLQKTFIDEYSVESGIKFFVLNRSSMSGSTLKGGCSQESVTGRFTLNSINNLALINTKNLTVGCYDFVESITFHPDKFMYLDPPYLLASNLYGVKKDLFDHEKLFETIRNRRGWILSYNNHPVIREIYKDFECRSVQWSYGMNSSKKSSEILILNL